MKYKIEKPKSSNECRRSKIDRRIRKEMREVAENLQFERAAELRDKIIELRRKQTRGENMAKDRILIKGARNTI